MVFAERCAFGRVFFMNELSFSPLGLRSPGGDLAFTLFLQRVKRALISAIFVIGFGGLTAEAALITVVTNTNDAGPGSLRQAFATLSVDEQIITFSDGTGGTTNFYDNEPDTITLTTGELVVSGRWELKGPGAGKLQVNGNGRSRNFRILEGAELGISGLTVAKGGGWPWARGYTIAAFSSSQTAC
jgi:hypothetical protein